MAGMSSGLSDRVTLVDADAHLPKDLGILRRNRTNTGLPYGSYDLIISILSLFKSTAEASVKEMRNLIAKDGTIVVVESHKFKKWVDRKNVSDSLPALFTQYGFTYSVKGLGGDKCRFKLYTLKVR
jgi:hypothetical protein